MCSTPIWKIRGVWPWSAGLTVVVLGCTVSGLGGSSCIAVSSVEQTGRKVSPSSRAEAWNIKTAPVHVPGRRGVTGSQESGPAIVCIYIGGCQEVWAA